MNTWSSGSRHTSLGQLPGVVSSRTLASRSKSESVRSPSVTYFASIGRASTCKNSLRMRGVTSHCRRAARTSSISARIEASSNSKASNTALVSSTMFACAKWGSVERGDKGLRAAAGRFGLPALLLLNIMEGFSEHCLDSSHASTRPCENRPSQVDRGVKRAKAAASAPPSADHQAPTARPFCRHQTFSKTV